MNKIDNIQGLRGIAVLLVVFTHLFFIEKKYGGELSIIPEFVLFGFSGVDLFFIISGFVMVTVTRGKLGSPIAALKFIYHRIVRIYPVYWIYSILVLIVFLLKPSWVNSAQGNQVDIISSLLLLPQNSLPLVNVGWSLIHEMYFYWFFTLIVLLLSETFLPLTLAGWGGILVFSHFFNEPDNLYLKLALHPLTLEFIGGCFIAIFYYNYEIRQNHKVLLAIAIISFMLLIAGHEAKSFISEDYSSAWWWRVLTFGIPSLLIVHSLVHLENQGYILPKWLIAIGDASYSIYLSHVLMLSALGRIWTVFASNGVIDNILAAPVLIALVLGFGLLSYHKIEKPIMVFFRKIA